MMQENSILDRFIPRPGGSPHPSRRRTTPMAVSRAPREGSRSIRPHKHPLLILQGAIVSIALAGIAYGQVGSRPSRPNSNDDAAKDRATSVIDAFNGLKSRGAEAVSSGRLALKDLTIGNTTVRIVSAPTSIGAIDVAGEAGPRVQLALRAWGELAEGPDAGKTVSLTSYRWKANERFHLWIETAIPIQIALLQTLPDSRKPKLVMPSEKYPESFGTILPGRPYRYPVRFRLDDRDEDELMVVRVARPEAGLPISSPPPAAAGPGAVSRTLSATLERFGQDEPPVMISVLPSDRRGGPRDRAGPLLGANGAEDPASYHVGAGDTGQFVLRLRKS